MTSSPPAIPETIVNRKGERLAFTFTPGAPNARDIVVLGHGLTSDKDRPWSEALAANLARAGIASLRVAFSGNGESEGRFVESNPTKEVADLGAVLDALVGRSAPGATEAGAGWRPSYVGHSMGGAVGLLCARSDPRIVSLVSLAAVTHADQFAQRLFGDLSPGDPILGKPHCPFGAALRDDLTSWGSLTPWARDVCVPWLVVHGTADEIVPSQDSVDLHASASKRCELVLLDGTDHSFSGEGLQRLVDAVVPWLERQLAR